MLSAMPHSGPVGDPGSAAILSCSGLKRCHPVNLRTVATGGQISEYSTPTRLPPALDMERTAPKRTPCQGHETLAPESAPERATSGPYPSARVPPAGASVSPSCGLRHGRRPLLHRASHSPPGLPYFPDRPPPLFLRQGKHRNRLKKLSFSTIQFPQSVSFGAFFLYFFPFTRF